MHVATLNMQLYLLALYTKLSIETNTTYLFGLFSSYAKATHFPATLGLSQFLRAISAKLADLTQRNWLRASWICSALPGKSGSFLSFRAVWYAEYHVTGAIVVFG